MFDQGDIVAQNSVPDISKGVDKKSNASDSCLPSLRYSFVPFIDFNILLQYYFVKGYILPTKTKTYFPVLKAHKLFCQK